MSAAEQSATALAQRVAELALDTAWRAKKPIQPISEADGVTDIAHRLRHPDGLDRTPGWRAAKKIRGPQDRADQPGHPPAIECQRAGLWHLVAVQFL